MTVDLSDYDEPLKSQLQSAFETGNYKPFIPLPVSLPEKDWERLKVSCLNGRLKPLYDRLVLAGFVDSSATTNQIANAGNIAFAATKLDNAIATVREEGAVAASFALLTAKSDFRFTEQEKVLWNMEISVYGFSDAMRLN